VDQHRGGDHGPGAGGSGINTTGPVFGAGGGGGGGSSFAGTDSGATATAAKVTITYTPPAPPPTGHPDLKVFLKHQALFQSGHRGTYGIWITNTGKAATAKANPTVVTLTLPTGFVMVQGGTGSQWQCHKQLHSSTCTRSAPLAAGARTMITATVLVHTRAGKTRYATATVVPTDKTPADNTSTDKVVIRP
jgi:uncharacterized repeat protein (TIGR01451 family)